MEAHEVQCGPFRVDLRNECVWDEAGALHLRPKTFAVLRYFVAHPDRLVTKDELLAAVWPETVVHEAARTGAPHRPRSRGGADAPGREHAHPRLPPKRAHNGLGITLFWLGELVLARMHFEHGLALDGPQQRSTIDFFVCIVMGRMLG
jgi:hypothetical protein